MRTNGQGCSSNWTPRRCLWKHFSVQLGHDDYWVQYALDYANCERRLRVSHVDCVAMVRVRYPGYMVPNPPPLLYTSVRTISYRIKPIGFVTIVPLLRRKSYVRDLFYSLARGLGNHNFWNVWPSNGYNVSTMEFYFRKDMRVDHEEVVEILSRAGIAKKRMHVRTKAHT